MKSKFDFCNVNDENEAVIAAIRADLDDGGLAVIDDFFAPDDFARLKQEALDLLPKAQSSVGDARGNKKYSLKKDQLDNTTISGWVNSDEYQCMASRLLNAPSGGVPAITDKKLTREHFYCGYSILHDKGGKVRMHFDGTNYLNLILPLVIPDREDGAWGQLSYWGNIRTGHDSLPKRILASRLFQYVLPGKKFLSYKENAMVFFYGNRTMHGVEPTDYADLRIIANMNVRINPGKKAGPAAA